MKINLAGETVQDLIDALRRLDPDTKTSVLSVAAETRTIRELVLRPNDKGRAEALHCKVEEVLEWLDDNTMDFEERVSEARAACKGALSL